MRSRVKPLFDRSLSFILFLTLQLPTHAHTGPHPTPESDTFFIVAPIKTEAGPFDRISVESKIKKKELKNSSVVSIRERLASFKDKDLPGFKRVKEGTCFSCHIAGESASDLRLGYVDSAAKGKGPKVVSTDQTWRRDLFEFTITPEMAANKNLKIKLLTSKPAFRILWIKNVDGQEPESMQLGANGSASWPIKPGFTGLLKIEAFYNAQKPCPELKDVLSDLDTYILKHGDRLKTGVLIAPDIPVP